MELDALNSSAAAIAELGANLVLISPNTVTHIQAFTEEKKLSLDILSDPGNAVAARYGLRYTLPDDLKALYQQFGIDLEDFNGDDSWTLPLPARLIFDTEGVVRYAAINTDHTVRPDPEETITALRQIA